MGRGILLLRIFISCLLAGRSHFSNLLDDEHGVVAATLPFEGRSKEIEQAMTTQATKGDCDDGSCCRVLVRDRDPFPFRFLKSNMDEVDQR